MSKQMHTALPWVEDPLKIGAIGDISTADGSQCIAQVQQIAGDDRNHSERRRLTDLIVRAVNNHYALIEALEKIKKEAWKSKPDADKIYDLSIDALDRAKAGQP